MSIIPSTTQNARVVGKTLSGADVAFGPGTTVSLNLAKRSFLAVPKHSFSLTERCPTAVIPTDVPDGVLAALKAALDRDEIIVGHQPVLRPIRRGLLEPVYDEIDRAESLEQVRPTILAIASGRTRMDRHQPIELVRRLALHEAETNCRQPFLDFYGSILEKIPGVGMVEEHPQDKTTTRVRISESGGAIAAPSQRSPEQIRAVRDLL